MKKIIVIFVIILGVSFCYIHVKKDGYVGTYVAANNMIIQLKRDNTCAIINNLYKDSFITYGRYTIKDNKLNMKLEKGSDNYLLLKSINGEFKGSNIKLYYPENKKGSTFYKE